MYDIFMQLCETHNVTPYQVAKDAGVSQATLTNWKTGTYAIRDKTLQKLADYFHVSLSYLKGETDDPGTPVDTGPTAQDDSPSAQELFELLEMLRTRSECRMLFSLARDASPEDVRRAVAIIEALRKTGEQS